MGDQWSGNGPPTVGELTADEVPRSWSVWEELHPDDIATLEVFRGIRLDRERVKHVLGERTAHGDNYAARLEFLGGFEVRTQDELDAIRQDIVDAVNGARKIGLTHGEISVALKKGRGR